MLPLDLNEDVGAVACDANLGAGREAWAIAHAIDLRVAGQADQQGSLAVKLREEIALDALRGGIRPGHEGTLAEHRPAGNTAKAGTSRQLVSAAERICCAVVPAKWTPINFLATA